MKISNLFGKKVESAAGRSGYVLRVNAAGGVVTGFVCADGDENEFFVPAKSVKSVKNSLVCTYVCEEETGEALRLGRPVYDGGGSFLGKLTDITVEKYALKAFNVGSRRFDIADVISGDAVIIKNHVRFLKSDVKKDGKILFRRGTPVTDEIAQKAALAGEYVQTNLKTI